MNFVAIYVAAGVVTLAATLLQSHLEKKKRGPSFHDALYELTRGKAGLWKRFTHEILVPALAGLLVICFWPIAIFWLVKQSIQQRREAIEEAERKFRVTEEDLIEKLSIEEIERRERIDDPLGSVPDKPFGHLWPAWKSFADNLSPEDTIWSFAATDKSSYEPVRLGGYVAFDKSGAESRFITSRLPLPMDE
jgi:hypothetical protein